MARFMASIMTVFTSSRGSVTRGGTVSAARTASTVDGTGRLLLLRFECPKRRPYTFRTALYLPRTYWPSGEDCHYLNIWSPTLDPTARKPVMVWFHGGGYGVGSGNAHTATEGSRLAAEGEVVVVTLNHRLNWLGYLDLSAFGRGMPIRSMPATRTSSSRCGGCGRTSRPSAAIPTG